MNDVRPFPLLFYSVGFETEIDTAGCRAYNRNFIVGGVGMQWMLRIRKARREDARSIGACHYHCWQETYSGLISDEYLEAMNEAQNMERFEGLYLQTGRYQYVVLDGSQIVGFF